jgi:serine/threonine protein kinase
MQPAMSETPTPPMTNRARARSRAVTWPRTFDGDSSLTAVEKWQGRYVLSSVLGGGSTGVVHEAYDLLLDRTVALKELRGTSELDSDVLSEEARALAAVEHPAVVRVYAAYPDNDPPFLVMERLQGRVLSAILSEERLPFRSALALLRTIAGGLDALHAAGIVHGDVKPANVIVDDAGRATLIDAGLPSLAHRTSPGEPVGTPAYVAPERAATSTTPSSFTSRSDVYSFGVLAFELLCGRRPFVGTTLQDLIAAHRTQRPPMPSYVAGLSTELDAPIAAALAKRPEDRPATCGAVIDALDQASQGCDAHGRRLRVLVADDDEATLMLMMSVIGAHLPGASVVLCGSGASVLHAMSPAPSVAVLDLGMPAPSGIDLVRQVRERSPRTAIVIVTGSGSGTEREAARALGVKHFVVKPFELDELVRAIREAIPQHVDGTALADRSG